MTDTMKSARSRGLVPDWAWYQINGQSAQANMMEQKRKIWERLLDREDPGEELPQIFFTNGVKLR